MSPMQRLVYMVELIKSYLGLEHSLKQYMSASGQRNGFRQRALWDQD